jgi:RNA polymerase sigma-70 factor (ECF subfamily)
MEEFSHKKDEELIQMVLENSDIYAEIISRYKDKIFRYICRISSIANDDVEDLTQDIFLSAYENLNSFDTDQSFSSWIYRIAHNKTINFWKKHEREFGSISVEENMFIVDSVFNESSVQKDMEDIENKEVVENVLKHMSIKYREILILQYIEHKDYKEMSDILEKPMGSIATLVNRAKKQFKKTMLEMEEDFYREKDNRKRDKGRLSESDSLKKEKHG